MFAAPQPEAAEAVAAALAAGHTIDDVGEAISLAANRLLLCDPGRSASQAQPGKPEGSVHGASVGVHASDSANAWRHLAKVGSARHAVGSLIAGAWHTAGQTRWVQADLVEGSEERATLSQLEAQDALLERIEGAVEDGDQVLATAATRRWGELEHPAEPLFELFLRYAVVQDGALHAEKYFRTASEEYALARPAFRWRHVEGLARVTASQQGFLAPGVEEARELLGG